MDGNLGKMKEKIQKLLFNNKICSTCLEMKSNVTHWDEVYCIENEIIDGDMSLRDIFGMSFGYHILNLLPTTYFCDRCTVVILKSYLMITKIKDNFKILDKHLEIISKQAYRTPKVEENKKILKNDSYIKIDSVRSLKKPKALVKREPKEAFKSEVKVDKIEFDYECPFCGFETDTYEAYKDHCENLHSYKTNFKCNACDEEFTGVKKLVQHRNFDHCESIGSCDICKVILNSKLIKYHTTNEHVNDTFQCDICKSRFTTESSLLDHSTLVHFDSNIKCLYCLQSFNNEFKLKHHRCKYKCYQCEKDCIHEKYLQSYREQDMTDEKVFRCTDCDFTYTVKNQLLGHVNEEHLHYFPFLCDLCGDKFASRALLRTHRSKMHKLMCNAANKDMNSERFECEACGDIFNDEAELISHRKTHEDIPEACQFCSKMFLNNLSLNMHLKKYHAGQEDGKDSTYQCTMCTMDFSYRNDYLKHIATHPNYSKHICRFCKKSFVSKKNYYFHVRKHQSQQDQECYICFKKFTKHHIYNHIKSHKQKKEDEMSVMCDTCGALLPNKRALIRHNRQHMEDKECPHCKKLIIKTRFNSHVKRHLDKASRLKSCPHCDYVTLKSPCLDGHINRYHLKIRPHQCEICSKPFYSDETLQRHRVIHAEKRPECYCEICGNKFKSQRALTFHLRLHTGERPYKCDLCDLRFLSTTRRKQHMMRKHEEPTIPCEFCGKLLYTNGDLLRHLGDLHGGVPTRRRQKKRPVLLKAD